MMPGTYLDVSQIKVTPPQIIYVCLMGRLLPSDAALLFLLLLGWKYWLL